MSIILTSIAILGAAFTRLVPEDGISKAFTLRGEGANAVDIPGDTHWIKFTFTPDDESEASKSAKGVWKQTEMIAE